MMDEKLGNKNPFPRTNTWETARHFGVDGKSYTDFLFKIVPSLPENEEAKKEHDNAKNEFADRTNYPNEKLADLFNESSEKDWRKRPLYYMALWKEMQKRDIEDNKK